MHARMKEITETLSEIFWMTALTAVHYLTFGRI
jgi:hypothetical protein